MICGGGGRGVSFVVGIVGGGEGGTCVFRFTGILVGISFGFKIIEKRRGRER